MWSSLWALGRRDKHYPSGWQTEQTTTATTTRNNMKTSGMRRALALANVFNLLVAIYFIVISIISLVQLRWYHQLTITTKVRHIITSTTSYFAFLILLAVAVVLVAIFVIGTSKLSTKIYISSFKNQDEATTSSTKGKAGTAAALPVATAAASSSSVLAANEAQADQQQPHKGSAIVEQQQRRRRQLTDNQASQQQRLLNSKAARESIGGLSGGGEQTTNDDSSNFCSMLLNLIAAMGIIVIIVIWLLNTGELVRDSISTQLDFAFGKYQFSNRSNHYSVAIDAMQNINNCCGSLDYTDFPHQRMSGLSTGHYPGSCCGKNIFGVMARVLCTPEEIVRAKQTTGCVIAIANHYDLVSLLIVPVALASLFVCIMVMAMMTLLKGHESSLHQLHHQSALPLAGPSEPVLSHTFVSTPDKLELINATTTAPSRGSSSNDDGNITTANDTNQQPTAAATTTASASNEPVSNH